MTHFPHDVKCLAICVVRICKVSLRIDNSDPDSHEFCRKASAVITTASSPDRIAFSKNKLLKILLAAYAIIFVISGIAPHNRFDWLLENLLSIVAFITLVASYRTFKLSDLSYTLIFVFMAMHTVGSHYTYSLVPAGDWMQDTFEFSRNHYDRVVHFAFGLLLAYPVREFVMQRIISNSIAASMITAAFLISSSASYEVIEWIVAGIVDPEAGIAYMGTQGDVFDAQKDMALAGAGTFMALIASALLERLHSRQVHG